MFQLSNLQLFYWFLFFNICRVFNHLGFANIFNNFIKLVILTNFQNYEYFLYSQQFYHWQLFPNCLFFVTVQFLSAIPIFPVISIFSKHFSNFSMLSNLVKTNLHPKWKGGRYSPIYIYIHIAFVFAHSKVLVSLAVCIFWPTHLCLPFQLLQHLPTSWN